MPWVPYSERAAYDKWADDNSKAKRDTMSWVHESTWQDFLLRKEEAE